MAINLIDKNEHFNNILSQYNFIYLCLIIGFLAISNLLMLVKV